MCKRLLRYFDSRLRGFFPCRGRVFFSRSHSDYGSCPGRHQHNHHSKCTRSDLLIGLSGRPVSPTPPMLCQLQLRTLPLWRQRRPRRKGEQGGAADADKPAGSTCAVRAFWTTVTAGRRVSGWHTLSSKSRFWPCVRYRKSFSVFPKS